MFFKPVDEMSLRQLFSSDYSKSQILLSYIGPVITPTGSIDTSPDALVLDMRKSPYQTKRCEFKFIPTSKSEPTAEIQPTHVVAGQDPFKNFLYQKPNYPNSSVKPADVQVMPTQTGKDPFKEFLDKQKQNSKDQVISPFGKN